MLLFVWMLVIIRGFLCSLSTTSRSVATPCSASSSPLTKMLQRPPSSSWWGCTTTSSFESQLTIQQELKSIWGDRGRKDKSNIINPDQVALMPSSQGASHSQRKYKYSRVEPDEILSDARIKHSTSWSCMVKSVCVFLLNGECLLNVAAFRFHWTMKKPAKRNLYLKPFGLIKRETVLFGQKQEP